MVHGRLHVIDQVIDHLVRVDRHTCKSNSHITRVGQSMQTVCTWLARQGAQQQQALHAHLGVITDKLCWLQLISSAGLQLGGSVGSQVIALSEAGQQRHAVSTMLQCSSKQTKKVLLTQALCV
jgi:hypothetical protein